MRFWRRNRARGEDERQRFRRIVPTTHIAEFRGRIPASIYAEHHIWCGRLDPSVGKELVLQGYEAIGVAPIPSHSLYCIAKLGQQNSQTRFTFAVFFALDSFADGRVSPSAAYSDSVAERIATKLAQAMMRSSEPAFLIRCLHSLEYPWCMSAEAFDQHWLIEAGVHYRSVLRDLARTGTVQVG